jgi:hypothetical protein
MLTEMGEKWMQQRERDPEAAEVSLMIFRCRSNLRILSVPASYDPRTATRDEAVWLHPILQVGRQRCITSIQGNDFCRL